MYGGRLGVREHMFLRIIKTNRTDLVVFVVEEVTSKFVVRFLRPDPSASL